VVVASLLASVFDAVSRQDAILVAEVVELLNALATPAIGQVDPSSPWLGNPSFKIRYDPAGL
jgi:hypothetical protein